MKILVVTWFFPPANTIAAVRLSKLAGYLTAQGHEVRVLTARDIRAPQGLEHDIDPARVTATTWFDVKQASARALGTFRAWKPGIGRKVHGTTRTSGKRDAPAGASGGGGGIRRWLRDLLFFPDFSMGWIPHGVVAGRTLLRDWPADLIYASGPPFSTLVIGWRLARRHGVPLITEFRDRWSDDPYYPPSALRQRLDRWLETRIVRDSRALVTVSAPWAERYRARCGKPVHVLYNGYDPATVDPKRAGPPSGGPLRIVYTGHIYPGRRDPSLLFAGMARLPADPDTIRVDFYGTDPAQVWPLADHHGVRACVHVHPPVLQPEAVRRQLEADVLLLMQWQDPREQGNVPGKLFEYLGARRPILLIGLAGGVPDSFIRARGAGALARDADHVAALLREWLDQKRAAGRIPLLPPSTAAGLSHAEQFASLPAFLNDVLGMDSAPAEVATAA